MAEGAGSSRGGGGDGGLTVSGVHYDGVDSRVVELEPLLRELLLGERVPPGTAVATFALVSNPFLLSEINFLVDQGLDLAVAELGSGVKERPAAAAGVGAVWIVACHGSAKSGPMVSALPTLFDASIASCGIRS